MDKLQRVREGYLQDSWQQSILQIVSIQWETLPTLLIGKMSQLLKNNTFVLVKYFDWPDIEPNFVLG